MDRARDGPVSRRRRPRHDRDDRLGPMQHQGRRGPGRTGRPGCVLGLALHAAGGPRQVPVQDQRADGEELRGAVAHHHPGARQGHRRGSRRDSPYGRNGRDRDRRHQPDDGLQPRGRRGQEHRRDGRAPAARCRRLHHAVQLPHDDDRLLVALRDRSR